MKQPISVSRALGRVVVTVHGAVDAELLDQTLALVGADEPHLVIDLRDADSIDRRAVGVLIEASRQSTARGGDLVLSAPPPAVRHALDGHGLAVMGSDRRAERHQGQPQPHDRQPDHPQDTQLSDL
jgi:anti-anti-sigma factor